MTQVTPGALAPFAIGETTIRQHDGLYSLNDLHRAGGGEKRHQPSDFLRLEQTQALIVEIGNSGNSRSLEKITGRNGGTYACRELVIAYAAWISAAFHLKVILVFLDRAAPAAPAQPALRQLPPVSCLPSPAATIEKTEHEGRLYQAVCAKTAGDGNARHWLWGKLNARFGLASYKNLPLCRVDEALAFVESASLPAVPSLPAPQPALRPPVWTKPMPSCRRYPGQDMSGAPRTVETANTIVAELKEWTREELPRPASDELQAALYDLHNLLVTGWTEVDEALMSISQGMRYLNRWNKGHGAA